MNQHRLDALEKTVQVMGAEFTQVLQEMQVTIQGITKTYSTALKVILARLDEAEKQLKELKLPVRQEEEGKEL